jgi:hypothetical protein
MEAKAPYWFRAKRYGWGWGLPLTWQGWLAYALYWVLLLLGFALFPPQRELAAFLAYTVGLSALLVVICWLKGEPPSWRWGDKQ